MPTINPHINFNGNAEEAFNFYKSVFGGEFLKIVHFKDIPGSENHITEGETDKIMHIALSIGHNILIGNDVPKFMGTVNENENRSKISISTESKEEAEKLFNGLSEAGEIEVPFNESPDGNCFAMFRDKFGIEWIVIFEPNK